MPPGIPSPPVSIAGVRHRLHVGQLPVEEAGVEALHALAVLGRDFEPHRRIAHLVPFVAACRVIAGRLGLGELVGAGVATGGGDARADPGSGASRGRVWSPIPRSAGRCGSAARGSPSPSASSSTSTVLLPGGVTESSPFQPQVKTTRSRRFERDVLAAGDRVAVDVAMELTAGSRVQPRRAAHPLDHPVGLGEEVEDRLRACGDPHLDLDRFHRLCVCHVCSSSAAPARRPASAARDDLSRTRS